MNPSGKGYGHGQKKESSEWSGELIVTIATSNNPDKSGVLSNGTSDPDCTGNGPLGQ